eukprot:CAMPEP_0115830762 /NCGR_PEP_ID=MMETSP0287-20121206/1783_1 /TAXON_ID=412157 /ORGANISM="Chrysochromulina rotalis, Strain UIO044" /LENGTH=89 /DNA_ID=CAMNT_0003284073 /DNA_START=51 /DNA_END=320 /DNA_ORIENTATION=-
MASPGWGIQAANSTGGGGLRRHATSRADVHSSTESQSRSSRFGREHSVPAHGSGIPAEGHHEGSAMQDGHSPEAAGCKVALRIGPKHML